MCKHLAATGTLFCLHLQPLLTFSGYTTSQSQVTLGIESIRRSPFSRPPPRPPISTTSPPHRFLDISPHRVKSPLASGQHKVHPSRGYRHGLLIPSPTLGIVSRIFRLTVLSSICHQENLACMLSCFHHQSLATFPR